MAESGPGGYSASSSSDCTIASAAANTTYTCTITNTYTLPIASGGSGGTIIPLIGLKKVPNPLFLSGPGQVIYNYTVWNVGNQDALTSVTVTDNKCSPLILASGDVNSNNKLDPGEIWKYTCTATLSKTTTNTSVATGYSDDVIHNTAVATAIATVAVGEAMPPLINIVKMPSRLTPFAFGGGSVAYQYTVTNPGTVAMHDVAIADDKCAPVVGPSGDTNTNNLLDPSETWAYTCQTNVPVSTRNIATVSGQANGFTALGYAFSTVLVSTSNLSSTISASTATDMIATLMGQIQSLQTQLAALKGNNSNAAFGQQVRTIAIDLGRGSKGNNVAVLQQFLASQNKGPAAQALAKAGSTAYFGDMTRAALAEFQAKVGISPASGNFGPITRAYLNAHN